MFEKKKKKISFSLRCNDTGTKPSWKVKDNNNNNNFIPAEIEPNLERFNLSLKINEIKFVKQKKKIDLFFPYKTVYEPKIASN